MLFSLIYHSPAVASTALYTALLICGAVLAVYTYRREIVAWHRTSPRAVATAPAIFLAVVVAVSSADALTPIPGCMADSWQNVPLWCKILDWLY
jgi:hypothetical protein